jgi:hypothetical protein
MFENLILQSLTAFYVRRIGVVAVKFWAWPSAVDAYINHKFSKIWPQNDHLQ